MCEVCVCVFEGRRFIALKKIISYVAFVNNLRIITSLCNHKKFQPITNLVQRRMSTKAIPLVHIFILAQSVIGQTLPLNVSRKLQSVKVNHIEYDSAELADLVGTSALLQLM